MGEGSGVIIGVDIGGTKIAAGIVRNGEVLRKMQVKTGATEGQTYVIGQLRALILGVAAGDEIEKVCIGVPGLFSATSIVRLPHIPCMNGVDLRAALAPVIGDAKLFLENDARSFVIAEHACGAAKGCKNVVGITLGTGLGAGIIINDDVYCGSHGSAGELGHVMFDTSLQSFTYGVGVWESLVSGNAITVEYEKAGGHPELVSQMWAEHSPVADAVRQDIIRKLAIFAANIMTTFDPGVIVFGGGAANEEMIASINDLLPKYNARPLLKLSSLKSDAGILGACISSGKKS